MDRQLDKIKKDIKNLASPVQETVHEAELGLVEAGSRAVRLLIKAAAEPDPTVRGRAAWALGRIGDKRAFSTLVSLTQDPDEDVRYNAVIALGDLGDERAIDTLVDFVRSSATEEVLSSAAGNALAELGEPAIRPLIGVMLTGSPEARVVAAYTLGHIASPAAIEPMAELLNDPNEWVRMAGIESLGRMAESLPLVFKLWCCELIGQCLHDPVERVREGALYWLDDLKNRTGLQQESTASLKADEGTPDTLGLSRISSASHSQRKEVIRQEAKRSD